ncbi:MAG: hypothetical protein QM681_09400 [Novosphingobium sp.]
MKHAFLLTATAVLALSACGKPAAPTAEATATASAEATPAAATSAAAAAPGAAAFTAGEAPSKAFMVGTWGEGEACAMPIKFEADGTIKDGPFAKWDIKDGALVMEGAPQKMKLKVVDAKTMESQLEGVDKVRTLKRCG